MSKYVTGGVSQNRKGTWKVRHSTLSIEDSVVRQVKAGDEHIKYVDLPREMSREELPVYLLTLPEFSGNADYKAVLEATIVKKTPKVVKAKVVKTKISSKPAATAAAQKAA